MRTIFELSEEEINQVEFRIELICDRTIRSYYLNPRRKYSKIVRFDFWLDSGKRIDMFWVKCWLGDFYLGSACIEPSMSNSVKGFYVAKNHCSVTQVNWEELKCRISDYFIKTEEYQQQLVWVERLKILTEWDKKELEEY